MFTVYIIYKEDDDNPEKVAIFYNVGGIYIDNFHHPSMIEIYQDNKIINTYFFKHIINMQYLEEVGK